MFIFQSHCFHEVWMCFGDRGSFASYTHAGFQLPKCISNWQPMPSAVLPLSIRCLVWKSRNHFLLSIGMYLPTYYCVHQFHYCHALIRTYISLIHLYWHPLAISPSPSERVQPLFPRELVPYSQLHPLSSSLCNVGFPHHGRTLSSPTQRHHGRSPQRLLRRRFFRLVCCSQRCW
jgi:hypothetical protein